MKKILAILIIAVAITSCSKDSSSSSPTFKPSVTKLNLASKVPTNLQQTSPDSWNQISQMDAYMNLGAAYMTPPSGKTASSGSTYTWTYGNYAVSYTYSQVGTQYQYTYTMTQNGATYCSITGWEYTDGSAGHWAYTINTAVVGAPTGSDYNITFDWTKSTIGDYHFVMNFDMGSSNNLHYVANINHDYSGDFLYTSNSTQYYGGSWNAAGHGSYTNYLTSPATVTLF
jgi:hypothetical protein